MRLREPSGALPARVERLLMVCASKLDIIAEMLESGTFPGSGEAVGDAEGDPGTESTERGGVAESLAVDSLVIAKDLLRQVREAQELDG